jgi:hypothetical protein
MNCPRCDTEMTSQVVSICFCDMQPLTKIEGVPADVCPNCGERLYAPDTVAGLEAIQDRFGDPDRLEQVAVYDFGKAAPTAATNVTTTIAAYSTFQAFASVT